MRFLADESCDFRVIRALRAAGHDVVAVAEVAAGAEDGAIIEMAMNQGRIFVTEDRDFGQLVYAAARRAQGVMCCAFRRTRAPISRRSWRTSWPSTGTSSPNASLSSSRGAFGSREIDRPDLCRA